MEGRDPSRKPSPALARPRSEKRFPPLSIGRGKSSAIWLEEGRPHSWSLPLESKQRGSLRTVEIMRGGLTLPKHFPCPHPSSHLPTSKGHHRPSVQMPKTICKEASWSQNRLPGAGCCTAWEALRGLDRYHVASTSYCSCWWPPFLVHLGPDGGGGSHSHCEDYQLHFVKEETENPRAEDVLPSHN